MATGEIGTLGCFVRVGSDAPCILGSAHVLTGGTSQADGVEVFHPPILQPGSREVAELWDAYPRDLTGQTESLLDAAVAVLLEGVQFDPKIGGLGPPTAFNPEVVEGERVRIHGAGSARERGGLILERNASATVRYDHGQASFSNLVRCERYSEEGDSGAAVLDANNCVVGVHLCGLGAFSWFCPISMVLARWPNIELITEA
jgi:hypothetical protein